MYDAVVKFLELTYDNNGNTHTKMVGSNTTTYAWDYENRMTSVTLPGSGGTVSFKYDPFGRRIYKSFSAGTTSAYAYDGNNLIEETNSTGGVVARYSQTQNIDEPLAMLRSAATSYFHADGLGSVTSLSNAAGSIANTYTYDSFGKLTASTGSLVNPFQYTARESDTETGLYYYRARYYDPSTGRFLGEDQIGNDEGANLYLYTRNNPINFNDPSGLYKLIGFSPGDAQKMRDAIDSAIKKLGESCDGCAGPDGQKIANALQNATFVYKANLKTQDGTRDECANARPINSKIIHVGKHAFLPDCCRLDSTLAHEATHKVTKSEEEHGPHGPRDVEKKCFNCGSGS
jgi:RHS repeat-associated protein